ncbi:unnamed protein product [Euphydryas editha]|uniref:Uncharacterized protein n=1 Tax=Euphydryas editha TaxID=104508 RepID=A0AAU9VBW4_EUPED|nr:unnamed protein product [Euphydryas editha]
MEFFPHFAQLALRLENAAAALGRLLPNEGRPDLPCRRLYAGVVRSMALYFRDSDMGALNVRNKSLLRINQWIIAARTIRGHCTVLWMAATLLASNLLWELQVEVLA